MMLTGVLRRLPLVFLVLSSQSSGAFAQENEVLIGEQESTGAGVCLPMRSAPQSLKRLWKVGVLVNRGEETAYNEFNATFNEYLSLTAGQRFTEPLQFMMTPLLFSQVFEQAEQVDFIYLNPSAFSCIDSERNARSLVSHISRRTVGGQTYDLKRFGGVIIARSNRADINSIQDVKDKVVAAVSISGLGSGQMQFRELQEAGLNYLTDPKQLVFTSNQGTIVRGVLSGEFDVGFIRTDQMERTTDEDGTTLIDPTLLKVIDAKENLGSFPFPSSTRLYPEWNLAALPHVPDDVVVEVQSAMLALSQHAEVARIAVNDSTMERRCDTTLEVAEAALKAMALGKYAGWAPSLSYMELRSMQEITGFIRLNETDNVWRCVRSAELYEAITCPAGQVKKTREEVENGCKAANLSCGEGYQCVCQPCYAPIRCFDSVNVFGRCVGYNVLLPAILVPIGIIIVAAFVFVIWFKSKQMVKQAEAMAKNERELNEFIAHEVRNPLSAAISASVFVNSAVQNEIDEDTRDALQEDAGIISSSLKFINDLLRSMLDINRATRDQMILEQDEVDILHDIFEPVASMIYNRDTNWTVLIKCPKGLVIKSDKLRLQQVVLNLARNSSKFVEEGFVRLRADIVKDSVHIYIEDSGPGIPEEKQKNLFNRYQQSLDAMAQGTGVGLNLCQRLVALMEGTIQLDNSYTSGFMGHPGACIDIDLNQKPELEGELTFVEVDAKSSEVRKHLKLPVAKIVFDETNSGLPRDIAVLYVDDDRNLRKFAIRSLRSACPNWYIREAASGEAALSLCELEFFDIIFIDQYMTSVEQCLKGTETVRALRSKGVKSVICGLSANDLSNGFASAGSDYFHMKPFPVESDALNVLLRSLMLKRAKIEYVPGEGPRSGTFPSSVVIESTDDLSALGTKSVGSYHTERQPSMKSMQPVFNPPSGLESEISVLFVDDDRILRRLAIRAMKKVMPNCVTRETDSGESALRLCESERFHLVFIDQHMTSATSAVERMKGSDAVAALRKQGVMSVITGLSANMSAESEFLTSGADNFQLKPFPCSQSELKPLLLKLLAMIGECLHDDTSTAVILVEDRV